MHDEVRLELKESGIYIARLGEIIIGAVAARDSEDIGEAMLKLPNSLENDDELEMFQNVLIAIAGQDLTGLIQEDQ